MTPQNKKAQEEMVGFVLIMLVVAIIFLVFLGIFLRNASKENVSESKEISSFLDAMFEYTTECGPSAQSPKRLSQLILDCSNQGNSANCIGSDGKGCTALKDDLRKAIESNWNFNENSPTKGYLLQILRETDKGEIPVINATAAYDITNNIRSAERVLPGGIILRLEIFY